MSDSGDAVLMVTMACPPEQAEAIASALVEARVAACVNIVPGVRSVYRWKGQVQRDDESLLLAKTTQARFGAFKALALSLHPYELPEIVAVCLTHAHPPYLAWVIDNTQ